jgi:hypothetical protein
VEGVAECVERIVRVWESHLRLLLAGERRESREREEEGRKANGRTRKWKRKSWGTTELKTDSVTTLKPFLSQESSKLSGNKQQRRKRSASLARLPLTLTVD